MHSVAFLSKYKLDHLLFWIMLFGLWYFFRYQDYSTNIKALQVTFVKVIDLALMVYITNYLLIPSLLYRKKYFLFALVLVLMITTSSYIKMTIIGHITNNPALQNLSGNIKARVYDNVIPHIFLVIAGAAIKLMLDHTRMQQRMVEIIKEKSEAELSFLKSQINPHFLFNSLNSVYFLIDKGNAAAREALHKFSDMLRYQLYEMNDDSIPIEKEISYLEDYVDLQRLRKDESFVVEFNRAAEVTGFTIPPLLLIPFVENAFKHISHFKDKPNFIMLEMKMIDDQFTFCVTNSKDKNEKTTEQAGGIGLNNVVKRLNLLFPGSHFLNVSDHADQFMINLKIHIKV